MLEISSRSSGRSEMSSSRCTSHERRGEGRGGVGWGTPGMPLLQSQLNVVKGTRRLPGGMFTALDSSKTVLALLFFTATKTTSVSNRSDLVSTEIHPRN